MSKFKSSSSSESSESYPLCKLTGLLLALRGAWTNPSAPYWSAYCSLYVTLVEPFIVQYVEDSSSQNEIQFEVSDPLFCVNYLVVYGPSSINHAVGKPSSDTNLCRKKEENTLASYYPKSFIKKTSQKILFLKIGIKVVM